MNNLFLSLLWLYYVYRTSNSYPYMDLTLSFMIKVEVAKYEITISEESISQLKSKKAVYYEHNKEFLVN